MLTFDDLRYPDGVCRNSACTEHPHCVCGARLDDDGSDRLVCGDCGTAVLVEQAHGRVEVAR